jgi:hypothetical protein
MKDIDPIEKTDQSGRSHHERASSKRRHRAGSPHPDGVSSGPQVIARIPRLPRHEGHTSAERERSSGGSQGRLVGKRISAWTLVGGVGFLVVVALVVPKAFHTKSGSDSGTKDAAHRSGPAPDAPLAPRWNGAAPGSDTLQATAAAVPVAPANDALPASTGTDAKRPGAVVNVGRGAVGNSGLESGPRPMEAPFAAGSATDASVARTAPSGMGPTYSNPPTQSPGRAPWEPIPGARRPDYVYDNNSGNGPVAQNRSTVDPYRGPARGGLVNAMPPGPPDNYNAVPPAARDAYGAMPPSPRNDYSPESRPDYRTAARSRVGQDAAPWATDDRRVTYPESLPGANYPGAAAQGSETRYGWSQGYRSDAAAPSYPNRGQPAGYEAGPPPTRQPAPGAASMTPPNPASPEWAGSPNWVTPPTSAAPNWNSAPWASPQAAPGPNYPATSYPTTGATGRDNWPNADAGVGAAAPPAAAPADYPAARFDGGIDRPSARDTYERIGPSIR